VGKAGTKQWPEVASYLQIQAAPQSGMHHRVTSQKRVSTSYWGRQTDTTPSTPKKGCHIYYFTPSVPVPCQYCSVLCIIIGISGHFLIIYTSLYKGHYLHHTNTVLKEKVFCSDSTISPLKKGHVYAKDPCHSCTSYVTWCFQSPCRDKLYVGLC
jgi:hypothetical protein